MSKELPKNIFKEGEELQVTQINNNCRIDYIIRKFEAWLPKELDVVKKDPFFSQIFMLHENGLGYSARVIHSFLCRELVTYKLHELWFVFARRPLRFSLQEFHAVTMFECNTCISVKEFEEWKYDGGFWSNVLSRKDRNITLFNLWTKYKEAVKKWRNADLRDEKSNIPLKYITVVMDLEKVRKYLWRIAAYDLLCKSIAKNRDKLEDKTTNYVLDRFSYALQIWAMEAVPKIGKLSGKKLDKGFKNGPRYINWMGAAKVSYELIIRLEEIITPEDQAFRRADDVEDNRIKVLMELIRTKQDFSEHIWETEETAVVSLSLDDESAVNNEASVNVEAAESDEDFQTPEGSKNLGARSKKGKKRLPDRGMEKRKQKVLSSGPKKAPFNEDIKIFVTQLLEQNFPGMEQRLQKQIAETFEQMRAELKDSHKEASVEVELGEPSPTKSSTSQTSLRRSKRGEMNAVMFIWRVKTTLNRWAPRRVAFMSAMLCLQLDAAYNKFLPNKKSFQLPDFLLGYGIGELPSHGRTGLVWGVDVDRLYFPLFVNVNHSLLCTS
ncbi:uncharacterized protein LOC106426966 [Brassica napus]|uniref:uncharacterized protein LOC106426966 n=1 Tax=Brassica napus TaxID=3708 RepID=UPI0006AB2182|nr:uncharacterized protein LOC106426966 [Brassica napus]